MSGTGICIYVLEVPEFSALIEAAGAIAGCRISQPIAGYTLIESSEPLEFRRKELGLKPAVWYGLFTGGLQGRITQFDRELVRVVA